MPYASQQNLIDRFGEDELIQLTDRTNTNLINATVIARALADADAEINGYLSSKYKLPLSPVPGVLEKLACDIARYQLYENAVTEIVKRRYEDVIRYLKDVVSGKASLGPDINNVQPAANNSVKMSSTTPVWKRANSGGFI